MIDLTKNERPFGLLSPEEQKAMKDWPHGWEAYYGEWKDTEMPFWYLGVVYRTKPAPLGKPSVDWSVFTDDVKCITRDKAHGVAWMSVPRFVNRYWENTDGDEFVILDGLIFSYDPGTCPDSEAIAYRPGYEPEGK